MKLDNLIKQITPLPWLNGSTSNDYEPSEVSEEATGFLVCECNASDYKKACANAAYIAIAANTLPKLVGALKATRAMCERLAIELERLADCVSADDRGSIDVLVSEWQAMEEKL